MATVSGHHVSLVQPSPGSKSLLNWSRHFLARKPAAQRSRCNAQKWRGLELVKTKEGEMFLQFARRHHCRDSSAIMSNAIRPRWRRGWSIERPGRLSPASDVVPVPLPAYVG